MFTEKQKMFCREYLVDFNATQAAIRAGYSEKTAYQIAHENLNKPEIKIFLQELMDKRAEKVGITAEYVLNNIKTIGERCMQAEEVIVKGVPIGEYSFDASNALKAQELLGKHLVLFNDKGTQNGDAAGPPVVVEYHIYPEEINDAG